MTVFLWIAGIYLTIASCCWLGIIYLSPESFAMLKTGRGWREAFIIAQLCLLWPLADPVTRVMRPVIAVGGSFACLVAGIIIFGLLVKYTAVHGASSLLLTLPAGLASAAALFFLIRWTLSLGVSART